MFLSTKKSAKKLAGTTALAILAGTSLALSGCLSQPNPGQVAVTQAHLALKKGDRQGFEALLTGTAAQTFADPAAFQSIQQVMAHIAHPVVKRIQRVTTFKMPDNPKTLYGIYRVDIVDQNERGEETPHGSMFLQCPAVSGGGEPCKIAKTELASR